MGSSEGTCGVRAHGVARRYTTLMALHGVAWRRMALHAVARPYTALYDVARRCMALHGVEWRGRKIDQQNRKAGQPPEHASEPMQLRTVLMHMHYSVVTALT